jgi:hypothetical protein
VYVVGLVAGALSLLHDKAGNNAVGVPTDTLGRVARGSKCVDSAKWWHVPHALEGVAWGIVPGSGPEGTDPWAHLEQAAAEGEASGVRVARALQVLVAGIAGRDEDLARGIRAFPAARDATPTDPDWALFDEYARLVVLHQSDVLWTAAKGHRTPTLGVLPGDDAPPADVPPGEDPFGP